MSTVKTTFEMRLLIILLSFLQPFRGYLQETLANITNTNNHRRILSSFCSTCSCSVRKTNSKDICKSNYRMVTNVPRLQVHYKSKVNDFKAKNTIQSSSNDSNTKINCDLNSKRGKIPLNAPRRAKELKVWELSVQHTFQTLKSIIMRIKQLIKQIVSDDNKTGAQIIQTLWKTHELTVSDKNCNRKTDQCTDARDKEIENRKETDHDTISLCFYTPKGSEGIFRNEKMINVSGKKTNLTHHKINSDGEHKSRNVKRSSSEIKMETTALNQLCHRNIKSIRNIQIQILTTMMQEECDQSNLKSNSESNKSKPSEDKNNIRSVASECEQQKLKKLAKLEKSHDLLRKTVERQEKENCLPISYTGEQNAKATQVTAVSESQDSAKSQISGVAVHNGNNNDGRDKMDKNTGFVGQAARESMSRNILHYLKEVEKTVQLLKLLYISTYKSNKTEGSFLDITRQTAPPKPTELPSQMANERSTVINENNVTSSTSNAIETPLPNRCQTTNTTDLGDEGRAIGQSSDIKDRHNKKVQESCNMVSNYVNTPQGPVNDVKSPVVAEKPVCTTLKAKSSNVKTVLDYLKRSERNSRQNENDMPINVTNVTKQEYLNRLLRRNNISKQNHAESLETGRTVKINNGNDAITLTNYQYGDYKNKTPIQQNTRKQNKTESLDEPNVNRDNICNKDKKKEESKNTEKKAIIVKKINNNLTIKKTSSWKTKSVQISSLSDFHNVFKNNKIKYMLISKSTDSISRKTTKSVIKTMARTSSGTGKITPNSKAPNDLFAMTSVAMKKFNKNKMDSLLENKNKNSTNNSIPIENKSASKKIKFVRLLKHPNIEKHLLDNMQGCSTEGLKMLFNLTWPEQPPLKIDNNKRLGFKNLHVCQSRYEHQSFNFKFKDCPLYKNPSGSININSTFFKLAKIANRKDRKNESLHDKQLKSRSETVVIRNKVQLIPSNSITLPYHEIVTTKYKTDYTKTLMKSKSIAQKEPTSNLKPKMLVVKKNFLNSGSYKVKRNLAHAEVKGLKNVLKSNEDLETRLTFKNGNFNIQSNETLNDSELQQTLKNEKQLRRMLKQLMNEKISIVSKEFSKSRDAQRKKLRDKAKSSFIYLPRQLQSHTAAIGGLSRLRSTKNFLEKKNNCKQFYNHQAIDNAKKERVDRFFRKKWTTEQPRNIEYYDTQVQSPCQIDSSDFTYSCDPSSKKRKEIEQPIKPEPICNETGSVLYSAYNSERDTVDKTGHIKFRKGQIPQEENQFLYFLNNGERCEKLYSHDAKRNTTEIDSASSTEPTENQSDTKLQRRMFLTKELENEKNTWKDNKLDYLMEMLQNEYKGNYNPSLFDYIKEKRKESLNTLTSSENKLNSIRMKNTNKKDINDKIWLRKNYTISRIKNLLKRQPDDSPIDSLLKNKRFDVEEYDKMLSRI